MESNVFLLLGTNLGDRLQYLNAATLQIEARVGKVLQKSAVYATAAWGLPSQPDFYNQVLRIQTDLSTNKLLHEILAIEHKLGRVRAEKWGARTIDIDILYFGGDVITEKELAVPHPAIAYRRFTLVPLVEISPKFIHPLLAKTNEVLLQECDDTLSVQRVTGN